MISKVKSLVKNHWKKVVVGGVVFQGARYALSYASNQLLSYHENKAKDIWKKVKKHQHFESVDSNCVSTFTSLLPTVQETISNSLDSESLTKSLKQNIPNKIPVWEELKILAFSRLITTIYGTSILFTLLRIQLSILGGYLFIESTQEPKPMAFHQSDGIILSNTSPFNTDLQQKYLSVANYFVRDGLKKISELVYNCTKSAIGDLPLKQKLTISDLEQIIWGIIGRIRKEDININMDHVNVNVPMNNENDIQETPSTSSASSNLHLHSQDKSSTYPVKNSWHYIFSPQILDSYDNFQNNAHLFNFHYEPPDTFKRLIYETFDLLDSDDVSDLLKSFEMQGVSHFLDRLGDVVADMSTPTMSMSTSQTNHDSSLETSTTEIMVNGNGDASSESSSSRTTTPLTPQQIFQETTVPLAKFIPLINSLSESFMIENDQWVQLLLLSDGAKVLGANVYEAFSFEEFK